MGRGAWFPGKFPHRCPPPEGKRTICGISTSTTKSASPSNPQHCGYSDDHRAIDGSAVGAVRRASPRDERRVADLARVRFHPLPDPLPSRERGQKRPAHREMSGPESQPRQRPTLAPLGTTIGADGLNDRVRNGNGCDPAAMVTGKSTRNSQLPDEVGVNCSRKSEEYQKQLKVGCGVSHGKIRDVVKRSAD